MEFISSHVAAEHVKKYSNFMNTIENTTHRCTLKSPKAHAHNNIIRRYSLFVNTIFIALICTSSSTCTTGHRYQTNHSLAVERRAAADSKRAGRLSSPTVVAWTMML